MTRPAVSDLTDRVYRQIPAVYRMHDPVLGWALLRLVRTFGDYLDQQADLIARLDRRRASDRSRPSDLTSPDHADLGWLAWLGQGVGVTDDASRTEVARRQSITGAAQGWKAGSPAALSAAAATALTGTRFVQVYPQSISTPGDGGRWDVLIVTRIDETPDVNAVLAAVSAADIAPAGVVLHHAAYTATWGQVTAAYPTWADINGKSWSTLSQTGL